MSRSKPPVPAQRALRASIPERCDRLRAEFKSTYPTPSETVDLLAPPHGRAPGHEADPAMALSASVTIRLLSEWLEQATALPWTLYSPAHAADALEDLGAALGHLATALPQIAQSVVRAAERGDVPARTGEHAATAAQALRDSAPAVAGYVEQTGGVVDRWRASPYRGYLVESDGAHIRAVAAALERLEPGIRITSLNLEEDHEGLRRVEFALGAREYFLVDNLDWEIRYRDWEIRNTDAEIRWRHEELELPIGIAVHPEAVAREALGAITRAGGLIATVTVDAEP